VISEESVKQVFWFLCAIIVSAFVGGSLASVSAQTASPTPDPFTVQLTSTPNGAFNSIASDITANGRFVVFTSNGDVATANPRNPTAIAKSFWQTTRNVAFSRSRIPKTFRFPHLQRAPLRHRVRHLLRVQRQLRFRHRLIEHR